MKESDYQHKLIKKLEKMFPGCEIMKNDSSYIQGIPDLTILYKNHWATLEVKISEKADHQQNQDYYVEKHRNMSYSAFIFPDNEKEVLNELKSVFEV